MRSAVPVDQLGYVLIRTAAEPVQCLLQVSCHSHPRPNDNGSETPTTTAAVATAVVAETGGEDVLG